MTRRAHVALLLAVTMAAVLHGGPVATLWQATGRALPPWVSSDSYLYLNLSHVRPDARGLVRNPWYGNAIPADQVPYLRFGMALRVFHAMSGITGDDGLALVLWHVFVAVGIAVTLFWMLRGATRNPFLLLTFFAVLMFVDAFYARFDLAQMRSGQWRWIHGFPFARTFYPQAGVPFVFASLGSLLRWLEDRRSRWLVLITILQFGALTVFPYAAIVIMAGLVVTAATAPLLRVLAGRDARRLALTVIAALGGDALWIAAGRGAAIPGIDRVLSIDLSQLDISRTIVVPLVLGLAALCLRRVDGRVRAVFGGFGIAIALPQLADAFLTPALLFGTHVAYFYTIGVWLPIAVMALAVAVHLRSTLMHVGCVIVTASVGTFAVLEAGATTRMWRTYNAENGDLARALVALGPTAADVVVVPIPGFRTPRHPYYWEASWVPLVSPATVLYSSHARMLLAPGSPEESDRLAAYLFLKGEDPHSLDALLAAAPTTPEQTFLVGYGRELFLESDARQGTLAEVRRALRPRLEALMEGRPPRPLMAASRVIVADYREEPVLSPDRLDRFLIVDQVVEGGVWRIRLAHPRL
jgi:hypothetical protein